MKPPLLVVRIAPLFGPTCVLLLLASPALSQTFTQQSVDTPNSTGHWTSLELNAAGDPHISYYDITNGHPKYAFRTGPTTWTSEIVDGADGRGTYTSLALDASGNPRITYYDAINGHPRYAYRTGPDSWTIELVDGADGRGTYTSLALDASGNPRMGYFDAINGHPRYAFRTGPNSWTTELVDAADGTGTYASLALDCQGNPRMSYYDSIADDLKFASQGAAGCPVGVPDDLATVAGVELRPPFPNPAASDVVFRFEFPASEAGKKYELRIFDLSGRQVRLVESGSSEAGRFSARWDLLDDSGRRVSAGLFYARLRIEDTAKTRGVLVLR